MPASNQTPIPAPHYELVDHEIELVSKHLKDAHFAPHDDAYHALLDGVDRVVEDQRRKTGPARSNSDTAAIAPNGTGNDEPIDLVTVVGKRNRDLIVDALGALYRERQSAWNTIAQLNSDEQRDRIHIGPEEFGLLEVSTLRRRIGASPAPHP